MRRAETKACLRRGPRMRPERLSDFLALGFSPETAPSIADSAATSGATGRPLSTGGGVPTGWNPGSGSRPAEA